MGHFCLACKKRETCKTICPKLQAELPGMGEGREIGGRGAVEQLGHVKRKSGHPMEYPGYLWGERERQIGFTRAALDSVRDSGKLDKAEWELVELLVWRGLSRVDAAREMGVTQRTISRMQQRIRSKLSILP